MIIPRLKDSSSTLYGRLPPRIPNTHFSEHVYNECDQNSHVSPLMKPAKDVGISESLFVLSLQVIAV